MKYCIKCITWKDESEFNWKNRLKNRLRSMCKTCNREYDKNFHAARTPEAKAKKIKLQSQRVDELVEKIVLYLLEHPCVDCHQKDIRFLDFDHLLNKEFNVSNMISNGHKWEAISEEIVKCEVRCANCHRIVTHERLNSRKQKLFLKYQTHLLTKSENMIQSINELDSSKKQT